MGPLWKCIRKTAVRLWEVLRPVPAERWCRIAAGVVLLAELGILLSASACPPSKTEEVFGEIHWYEGEG